MPAMKAGLPSHLTRLPLAEAAPAHKVPVFVQLRTPIRHMPVSRQLELDVAFRQLLPRLNVPVGIHIVQARGLKVAPCCIGLAVVVEECDHTIHCQAQGHQPRPLGVAYCGGEGVAQAGGQDVAHQAGGEDAVDARDQLAERCQHEPVHAPQPGCQGKAVWLGIKVCDNAGGNVRRPLLLYQPVEHEANHSEHPKKIEDFVGGDCKLPPCLPGSGAYIFGSVHTEKAVVLLPGLIATLGAAVYGHAVVTAVAAEEYHVALHQALQVVCRYALVPDGGHAVEAGHGRHVGAVEEREGALNGDDLALQKPPQREGGHPPVGCLPHSDPNFTSKDGFAILIHETIQEFFRDIHVVPYG
mmetsp:Transcript_29486/g.74187  ORF Transcript_29486/g.74187 Transcript_29486/m.74187 type:complete len:355 (-) Transcript_29486:1936-3000(-)